MTAILKAEKRTKTTVEAVNAFFGPDWLEYRAEVEALKPKIFKEIEPVKF